MQSSMLKAIVEDFGNGGTIDGDLTITGDLQVNGGGSLSFDEIIEGTSVIDVTDTEAFLVRKNGDGGDIFTVDTTNSLVKFGGTLKVLSDSKSIYLGAGDDLRLIHDGNHSYIDHENTGSLKIRSLVHGGDIVFHTEASDGTQNTTALTIDSDGNSTFAGIVKVDQNASTGEHALHIDSESTNYHNIFIEGPATTTAAVIRIDGASALTTGHLFNANITSTAMATTATDGAFRIDHTGNTTSNVNNLMYLHNNHASSSGTTVLKLVQDANAPALYIDNQGNQASIAVSSDDNVFISMDTTQSNGDEWQIMNAVGGTTSNLQFKNVDQSKVVMLMEEDGKIGISNTDPDSLLHIGGANQGGAGAAFNVRNDSGDGARIWTGATGGGRALMVGHLQSNASSQSIFEVKKGNASNDAYSAEMFVVKTDKAYFKNGNLGIGTTSPASAAGANALDIVDTNTSSATQGASLKLGSNDGAVMGAGHRMGVIEFAGAEDGGGTMVGGARIDALAVDAFTATGTYDHNSKLRFSVQSGVSGTDQLAVPVMILDADSRISLSNNDDGSNNTIFGKNAGDSDGAGDQNVFIGELAGGTGTQTDAADGNTGIGYNSLTDLTSGQQNTAIGGHSADDITSGGYNTAVGKSALATLTTGSNNVVVGRATFSTAADDEAHNIAIGNSALGNAKQDGTVSATNRELKHNVAIGQDALLGGTLSSTNHLEYNIAIGSYALDATSSYSKTGTIAIGHQSLSACTSGQRNVALGHQSGMTLTSADENIAIGYETMKTHLTGSKNVAIGHQVMLDTDAGTTSQSSSENVFIGYQVASGTWTDAACNHNVGIGNDVMRGALDGATQNVAVGSEALVALTTGDGNVALGYKALEDVNTGGSNVAIGNATAINLTSGTDNIAIGTNCLYNSTDVDKAVIIGKNAGNGALDSGADGVIGIGFEALTACTSGTGNIAIGYEAGKAITTGEYSTVIGYQALKTATVTAGQDEHTAVGYQALKDCNGDRNTAVGAGAMSGVDNSDNCVAVGAYALQSGGTSDDGIDGTVAIGDSSLNSLTTGSGTTAVGKATGLYLTTGDYNTAIGFEALYTEDAGGGNTAVGYRALKVCNNDTGGNTAVGKGALLATTSGNNNTAVGLGAGDSLQSGTNNVFIGRNSQASAVGGTNQVVIGGIDTGGIGDNYAVIGNSDTTRLYAAEDVGATLYAGSATVQTSDERIKEDIKDSSLGLNFINQLRAVEYKKRQPADYDESLKKEMNWYKKDKKPRVLDELDKNKSRTGFIAQEVGRVLKDIGFDDNNDIVEIDESNTQQMISYSKLVSPLVKAVQELSAKVEELESKLKDK